jgi:hypothetical protein
MSSTMQCRTTGATGSMPWRCSRQGLSFLIYTFVHWLGGRLDWRAGDPQTLNVGGSWQQVFRRRRRRCRPASPWSTSVALYGRRSGRQEGGRGQDRRGLQRHRLLLRREPQRHRRDDRPRGRDGRQILQHLPEAERLKIKADTNNRGYRDVWDTVHRNGKRNARDSFDLGFPVTADDPEVKAGTPLYAPNKWPEGMPGFRRGDRELLRGDLSSSA